MARKGVLLVDDEAMALKYFSKAFAKRFKVFSASSAVEALTILALHHSEIGVIVTDQRMPDATGVELLRIVRKQYPRTVRILTTAYTELEVLIEAINSGSVFSFVTKPWRLEELERALTSALEHCESEIRNHEQLEQKLEEFRAQVREGRTYEVAMIAAKIGHYVHNALCPVTLILDRLLENPASSNFPPGFLERVGKHVSETARTLKDLGQSSVPPEAGDFEDLDLSALFCKALKATEILRHEKSLEIECDIDDDIPDIRGVPAQIEKLFRFMIAEEVVSLPPKSKVHMRLVPHAADGEILGLNIEFEDFVPLRPGIKQDNLLDPFHLRSTNPREFGVFLASSYLIAHHHGGSLAVRIKENNSLLFSFFFPCNQVTSETQSRLRNLPKSPRIQ